MRNFVDKAQFLNIPILKTKNFTIKKLSNKYGIGNQSFTAACRLHIQTLNPNPRSPSRFSFGTTQSSKIKEQVDDPLMPSLSSFLPNSKPSIGFGTMRAEMPLCFKLLSVVAKTTQASLS